MTSAYDAQAYFDRCAPDRPSSDEQLETWKAIAEWERQRAEFFKTLVDRPNDIEYALRMAL